MSCYTFRLESQDDTLWQAIDQAEEQTIFHTRAWFEYLHRVYRLSPQVLSIRKDNEVVGYFCYINKHIDLVGGGVKIYYSPPMGTGTYTQGIALQHSISTEERIVLYKELAKWLLHKGLGLYLKVDDWQLRKEDTEWQDSYCHTELQAAGIDYFMRPTYSVDLIAPVEELWNRLHYKSCRYSINKARKQGLRVEEITRAEDMDAFLDTHYQHICDVSRRRGEARRDYQDKEKLRTLCHLLFPNRLLLLQVVGTGENGKEVIMATGIWCVARAESVWWTGASLQCYQHYCPNELLLWEAMLRLRERGSRCLNLCGLAAYKRKVGSVISYVPRFVLKRNRYIIVPDEWLKKNYKRIKRLFIR